MPRFLLSLRSTAAQSRGRRAEQCSRVPHKAWLGGEPVDQRDKLCSWQEMRSRHENATQAGNRICGVADLSGRSARAHKATQGALRSSGQHFHMLGCSGQGAPGTPASRPCISSFSALLSHFEGGMCLKTAFPNPSSQGEIHKLGERLENGSLISLPGEERAEKCGSVGLSSQTRKLTRLLKAFTYHINTSSPTVETRLLQGSQSTLTVLLLLSTLPIAVFRGGC